jgi:hypothetical protein
MATREPSASPSGFSCVTSTNRCASRISRRTAARSATPLDGFVKRAPTGVAGVSDRSLLGSTKDLLQPSGALRRVVEHEVERGSVLEVQLARDPALQERVR